MTAGYAESTTGAIGGYYHTTAGRGQSFSGGSVSLTTGEGTHTTSGGIVYRTVNAVDLVV